MYIINVYGKELTIKDVEESFYNIITRLQGEQGLRAETDIKIVGLALKIFKEIDELLSNELIHLFNNSDFLLLAKCIVEKQSFYYEPRKEEK